MTATPRLASKGLRRRRWPELLTHRWWKIPHCPHPFLVTSKLGATLDVNTLTGGSWYVLNTAANALPSNGRWLVAQITTTGSISGQLNYQVFPLGVVRIRSTSTAFDGVGTFGDTIDVVCGCMDDTACNYNADATNDDGSYVSDRSLVELRWIMHQRRRW